MKKTKILSKDQIKFIELFAKEKRLSSKFYLTGGTALAEFYIPYRYSEDLDFFSEQEVDTSEISTFLKTIRKDLDYKSFDINTSYNRNIILLSLYKYDLKLEFTYFPFQRIDEKKVEYGLKIDSIKDIAVNKLFTIYQYPRSRDFMDLYMINQKYGYSNEDLLKLAKIKFDWHIDPLKLGIQFMKAPKLKDYPNLMEKIDEKTWQNYFIEKAKNLKKKILK